MFHNAPALMPSIAADYRGWGGHHARKPLGPEGDMYVQDGNTLLIQVPVGPVPGGMALLAHTTFVPPENIVVLYHRVLRGVATLLQRAK